MMERLMQYVWQHRLWPRRPMSLVDGRPVEVLDPGLLNTASGPDFFNAKTIIDGQTWVGDVEMHVRASDWHRHGHDDDPAYRSVILHVVNRDDGPITRPGAADVLPQLKMQCTYEFQQAFEALSEGYAPTLPCSATIKAMPGVYVSDWLSSLLVERLYERAGRIDALLDTYHGDWETVTYITVARALGHGYNNEPLERLAKSVPLTTLYKHADSLTMVEAILLGQAGFLDTASDDDPYVKSLKDNYLFLQKKFGLVPPRDLVWKMRGMRPASFPHRRVAVLAALVCAERRIHSRIINAKNADDLRAIFENDPSPYWLNHFTLGASGSTRTMSSRLSEGSLNGLAINAYAPIKMAWALIHGNSEAAAEAVDLLETLPPESNAITKLFHDSGIKCDSAARSQALIQLKRAYCEPRKCLRCRFGHRMLALKAGAITEPILR